MAGLTVADRAALLRARLAVGLGHHDDRGASLVEYALLVALIAIVCIVAVQFLGSSASSTFSGVGSNLANP